MEVLLCHHLRLLDMITRCETGSAVHRASLKQRCPQRRNLSLAVPLKPALGACPWAFLKFLTLFKTLFLLQNAACTQIDRGPSICLLQF
jgi:hypothetical protein